MSQLKGNQSKIDMDKDGRLTKKDFQMLGDKSKKKAEEKPIMKKDLQRTLLLADAHSKYELFFEGDQTRKNHWDGDSSLWSP